MVELGAVLFEVKRYRDVYQRPSLSIVSTFSSVLLQPWSTCWDEDTLRNFWLRKPGDRQGEDLYNSLVRRMGEEGMSPEVSMKLFLRWVIPIFDRFSKNILICTDNPHVDISWINYYLRRYAASPRLEQLLQERRGEYCRILDASSWALGIVQLDPWSTRNQWMYHVRQFIDPGNCQPRKHTAVEDAKDVGCAVFSILNYQHKLRLLAVQHQQLQHQQSSIVQTKETQVCNTVSGSGSPPRSWAAVASPKTAQRLCGQQKAKHLPVPKPAISNCVV
jgi:hypothetical protein